MRAAIYARRSTAEQGQSIEGQVGACERFITQQGWSVGNVYADTASGWKENTPRPEFDAMMRGAQAGEFDVLVVWEVSRLSRQEDDRSALSIVWRLRGQGIEVHSVVEPATGVRLADDMSLLIKSHSAKEESDLKSQRVTRGKRQGVLSGVHQGANACYGYVKAGKQVHGNRSINRYKADPAAASVVRDIVAAYLQGRSPQEIADELNERAVLPPDPGKKHRYQRAGAPVWHQSVIRGLLSSPLLAGFATYKGVRIKSCPCASIEDRETWEAWQGCDHEWVRSVDVPGIVEPEQWEEIQRVMASRARPWVGGRGNHNSTPRFLLAGLAWCGECGERIGCRADRRKGGSEKRHVYKCRGRRLGGCELPIIEQRELDEAIRAHFVDQHTAGRVVDIKATVDRERERYMRARSAEAEVLRDELAVVQKEAAEAADFQRRVRKDYEAGAFDGERWSRLDGECEERLQRAREAESVLLARIETVEQGISTRDIDAILDTLNAVTRLIEGTLTAKDDVPQLNAQLHEIFERFEITRKGDRVIADPKLRREWLPEGEEADWITLDFGDESSAGVESRGVPGLDGAAEGGPDQRFCARQTHL